jgi:hypothetical protein
MNIRKIGIVLLALLVAGMVMIPLVSADDQTAGRDSVKVKLAAVLDKQVAEYNQAVRLQDMDAIKKSVERIDATLEKISEAGYTVDFTATSGISKGKNNEDIPATVKTEVRKLSDNDVKKGHSFTANEEQLKIINELDGKDITEGEFLEMVFPEALADMPKETKDFLYTKPHKGTVTNEDIASAQQSPDGMKAMAALIGIVVHPESYIDQDIFTAKLSFKSDSQVWLPYPWFTMPYMSVASELRRDNNVIYGFDYKNAYNVYYVKAGYSLYVTPGYYKTKGGHIAQAPPGYWPPSQTMFTETNYLHVY